MTDTNWRARAACRGADVALFFPAAGDSLEDARRMCSICPVRSDCLAEALRLRDVEGFRAGLTGDERRGLWFKNRRGQGKPLLGDVDAVSAVGVVRRRQALACMGYSLQDLGARFGVTESTMASHTSRARILRTTHDRWCRLYDDLKSTPGPSERTREMAARSGWLPPSAWDVSTIDDPHARPRIEAAA